MTLALLLFTLLRCNSKEGLTKSDVQEVRLLQFDSSTSENVILNLKLEEREIESFLNDFQNRLLDSLKFKSCYVINLKLESGQFQGFKTDGQFIEIMNDTSSAIQNYKFVSEQNILTKYWGIKPEDFCKSK
ncbi:MAG: hypothetical protein U0T79_09345 [Ferruginibacter sp.]